MALHLRARPVSLSLRRPLRAAWGETRRRDLLLVELEDEDGVVGRGEAAPLPGYDDADLATCRAALDAYAEVARDGAGGAALLEACRAVADVPHALGAVDLALWDLAGRRAGRPVAELVAGTGGVADEVPVNAVIGAEDRPGAAAAAAEAATAGFATVKLKVGVGDDAGRVAAVRAAVGPHVAIRLDANGAWDVEEAVTAIRALAPAGLELVEEPTSGTAGLRAVRERVPTRIAMDESGEEPGAAGSGAADVVVLKVGRSGGIAALMARAALVRTTGAQVVVASAFDGPLGIAAAVHAAAALRLDDACGLATLDAYEPDDLREAELDGETLADLAPRLGVRDGRIAVPVGGGLL